MYTQYINKLTNATTITEINLQVSTQIHNEVEWTQGGRPSRPTSVSDLRNGLLKQQVGWGVQQINKIS